ncbi:MAG: tetratricopeptide repeat protein, partial [Saccharothrix sp.]|nr:tetratricopeptide repeat protein [Saccharothrix sp.]
MTERTYRALLVANWQFPRDADHLPELNGPRLDLPLLRSALTNPKTGLHRRGSVTVLANRTRAAVLRRVEDFFRDASRDDQLLLYYSGHGRLNLEDQLYLCAKDTDTDRLVSTGIAARDLSQMIENSPARAKVVLLDCCYSGSFKSGAAHPERLGGEGRFVLTSSRRAQLTGDATDPDEASPFTRFVVEALCGEAADSDTDGFISIEDVYRHVRERMRAQSGSTPQRSFDHAVGELAMARALGTTPVVLRPAPAPAPTVKPSRAPARRRSATLSPEDARGGYTTAQALERRGDLRGARQAYQRLVDSARGDWAVLAARALATMLARSGDVDGAAGAYRLVVADGHRDWAAKAACELGGLLSRHGRNAAARDAYENAVNADHPEWTPLAALELAGLLVDQGDTVTARSLCQQAMDSGHAEWAPKAAVSLGDLLVAAGDLGAARAAYHRAVLSGHPTWSVRGDRGLRRMRAAGATSAAALGRTLTSDEHSDARWAAAETLSAVAGPAATTALVGGLGDTDPRIRQAAARALGARAESTRVPAAVPRLV